MGTASRLVRVMLAIGGTTAALLLAACTGAPAPSPSPSDEPLPVPSVSSTPAPTIAMTVAPEDTVEQARDVFDAVNGHTLFENPDALGSDLIKALEAAGFPRKSLEVTPDRTSVNLVPGSIQFAVRWNDECIVGQNGEGSDGYRSEVVPVLSTGKCLVGTTRPLDF